MTQFKRLRHIDRNQEIKVIGSLIDGGYVTMNEMGVAELISLENIGKWREVKAVVKRSLWCHRIKDALDVKYMTSSRMMTDEEAAQFYERNDDHKKVPGTEVEFEA